MKPKHLHIPLLLSIALVSVHGAHAASGTWIQTTSGPFNWGDSANWSGSTIADGADNTAAVVADITANQTINLDSARTIGNIVASDGSHDYTISGADVLALDTTSPAVPSLNVTPLGRSLTISSVIDGTDGVAKIGAGQLTLNGSAVNTFTGGITANSGTLNLNFANLSTPTDLVNSGNALTLGGGSLLITGNTTADTSQSLGNVTVNASGQILVNPNDPSRMATLTLGSIAPATSVSTLLTGQSSGATGTATITTTSGTLINDIYGGHSVFFNGTATTGYDWATTTTADPGPYTLSGLGSYTTLPTSGGSSTTNYNMTYATILTDNVSVNTLKMAPGGTNNVTLNMGTKTLTVEGGGLLFTGYVTGNVISNGTVTAGAGSSYKLFIHSYNSQFNKTNTSNPGITAVIADNGPSNPVSLVVTGNPGGTTGLFYLGNAANSFTGGLYLNNGAVHLKAGLGAINNNTIYVSGYSVIYDGVATANTTTSPIQLGDGAVLDFRLNTQTFTTSGAVTGNGGITLGQGGQGSTSVNFNSASNNFNGPIEYRGFQQGQLQVNSIGDASVLGSGDIRFGIVNSVTDSHIFNFGGSSGAPAADLTFNRRRFELAGPADPVLTHPFAQINNNSAKNFTINTDMLVTGQSGMLLTLGGIGSGISTYAGKIDDNPTVTTGITPVAVAVPIGSYTITLGSVTGISIGATFTGSSKIQPGTTITAIAPVTKQVTLSLPTIGTSSILAGLTISVPGVTSNVSITKGGASVWTLSGDNSFSGGLTLSGATVNSQLNINSATALGTGALTISGGDNAKIDNTSGSPITNSNNNAMVWANNFAFVGSNALNLGTGEVRMTSNRTVTVTASTLTVGGAIGDLGGARSLTKSGAGTLMLNGTNTYTGLTTVSAGTIAGTGTIAGSVTVDAAGSLAPGVSAGTLAITGALDISAQVNGGSGKLKFELGSIAASDKITAGGTLTIGAGILDFSDFAFSALSGLESGTYTLIGYGALSGTLPVSGLGGTIGAGPATGTLQLNATSKTIELVVANVGGGTAYDSWAGGAANDADANGDGVKNGLAFLLGAATPTSAVPPPTVTQSGGNLILTFNCLPVAARGTATLKVAHGTTLRSWTTTTNVVPDATNAVPDNNVTFVVGAGPVGHPALKSVTATINSAAAGGGGKLFGRLEATQP